eukprot:g81985.t1
MQACQGPMVERLCGKLQSISLEGLSNVVRQLVAKDSSLFSITRSEPEISEYDGFIVDAAGGRCQVCSIQDQALQVLSLWAMSSRRKLHFYSRPVGETTQP